MSNSCEQTKFRRKPHARHKNGEVSPLPSSNPPGEPCPVAVFNGLSVEVASEEGMQRLHLHGCHGKSCYRKGAPQAILHAQKNKKKVFTPPENDQPTIPAETLTLSLEEAFFLGYCVNNVLRIVDVHHKDIQRMDMLAKIEAIQPNFLLRFAAYLHLRSKGWVVKSGLKFGCEFLIYKMGPQYYHASYVVSVNNGNTTNSDNKIRSLCRIAHSNGKDLLLLTIEKPPDFQKFQHLNDITSFTVKEMILRRFVPKLHVQ